MAKKAKAAKKDRAKKPRGGWGKGTPGRAAAVEAAAARKGKISQRHEPRKRRNERSQPLPGMEESKHVKLDAICENIGELLDQVNDARRGISGERQAGLQIMHDDDIGIHRFAGVELARMPGSETLRVRRVKAEGRATSKLDKTDDQGAPEIVDSFDDEDVEDDVTTDDIEAAETDGEVH